MLSSFPKILFILLSFLLLMFHLPLLLFSATAIIWIALLVFRGNCSYRAVTLTKPSTSFKCLKQEAARVGFLSTILSQFLLKHSGSVEGHQGAEPLFLDTTFKYYIQFLKKMRHLVCLSCESLNNPCFPDPPGALSISCQLPNHTHVRCSWVDKVKTFLPAVYSASLR